MTMLFSFYIKYSETGTHKCKKKIDTKNTKSNRKIHSFFEDSFSADLLCLSILVFPLLWLDKTEAWTARQLKQKLHLNLEWDQLYIDIFSFFYIDICFWNFNFSLFLGSFIRFCFLDAFPTKLILPWYKNASPAPLVWGRLIILSWIPIINVQWVFTSPFV